MDWIRTLESLSLGSRLKRLSDQLMQDVADIYKQQGLDLNPTCFPLLQLLVKQSDNNCMIGVSEAAKQLGVTQPAISRMVGKLEKDGWLQRQKDPQDDRRQLLVATEKTCQQLPQFEPVWAAIRQQLDQLMQQQQLPLLESINEFEDQLASVGSLKSLVLQQLQSELSQSVSIASEKLPASEIEVINWDPQFRDDFCRLNRQWLKKYFPKRNNCYENSLDQKQLEHPESYYLAKGGYIWFARYQQKIIGCLAMYPHSLGKNEAEKVRGMELSKMAVDESLQGLGVGRKLVINALDKARELAVSDVFLETASQLKAAITLYQNTGFTIANHPDGESRFNGADVYMALKL